MCRLLWFADAIVEGVTNNLSSIPRSPEISLEKEGNIETSRVGFTTTDRIRHGSEMNVRLERLRTESEP